MSDALYPTRLRWDAHSARGVAMHDGVRVALHAAPELQTMRGLTEIDYVPNVIAVVRIGAGSLREMEIDERREALALLQAMSPVKR